MLKENNYEELIFHLLGHVCIIMPYISMDICIMNVCIIDG